MKLKKRTTQLKEKITNSYYKYCSELPLWNFIKCMTNKNVNYLIISGNPDTNLLNHQWGLICDEYTDLSEDATHSYLLDLFTQISYLDEKLRIVYNIIAYLERKRSEGLIEILQNELGFPFSYSEETMLHDLKMTVSAVKMDKVNLGLSEAELKAYKDRHVEATEVDYIKLIIRLGKFQGYQINQKETTVLEFASILNDFTNSISSNKKLIPTEE